MTASVAIGACLAYLANAADGNPGPVYLCRRAAGRRVEDFWLDWNGAISALEYLGPEVLADPAATLEVTCFHDPQPLDGPARAWAFDDDRRGRIGIETDIAGRPFRLAPNRTIATNRAISKALARQIETEGEDRAPRDGELPLTVFETAQLLLAADLEGGWAPLVQGRRVPEPGPLSWEAFLGLLEGLAHWLRGSISDEGALRYKYWPSRGKYSEADNTIRQFLGALALLRYGAFDGTPEARQAGRRNLRQALRRYGGERDGFAVIAYGGSAKLGAAALAALSLQEGEDADLEAQWAAKLDAGIDRLWQEDGSFRTFHEPEGRNDNQNFYPGEALVYWTSRAAQPGHEALGVRIERSFRYYREWHRAQPNPAFVPWHSMAYAPLFEAGGSPDYRDFVFEMNDWLLTLQQTESAPAPDCVGRFFCPERPDFGPPHASSTAVYLEGLIAAARVAHRAGDKERFAAYGEAIALGFRNLYGLQFRDLRDFYYLSKRERVFGGLRTEGYDNTLRIDNAAHAVLAALALLDFPPLLDWLGWRRPETGDRPFD